LRLWNQFFLCQFDRTLLRSGVDANNISVMERTFKILGLHQVEFS